MTFIFVKQGEETELHIVKCNNKDEGLRIANLKAEDVKYAAFADSEISITLNNPVVYIKPYCSGA
jgi:hypothetical protein